MTVIQVGENVMRRSGDLTVGELLQTQCLLPPALKQFHICTLIKMWQVFQQFYSNYVLSGHFALRIWLHGSVPTSIDGCGI